MTLLRHLLGSGFRTLLAIGFAGCPLILRCQTPENRVPQAQGTVEARSRSHSFILQTSPWPKFQQNNANTGEASAGGSNGLARWTFATGDSIYCSPIIGADGTVYIGSEDNNLYAVNPNGTQKWSWTDTAGGTNPSLVSSPAIGSDGTIYLGSDDRRLYAINSAGVEQWSFLTGGSVQSSPAIGSDGTIYVGSFDNYLYAINPDGTEKWKFLTGNKINSSPAIDSSGVNLRGFARQQSLRHQLERHSEMVLCHKKRHFSSAYD